MSLDFEESLKLCIKKESEIISKLYELREEVEKFHTTCNAVKTGGTVVSAVGTVVLVSSVIAAPFTGGLSLLGTAVGLGSTVAGGVTNAVTDVVDHFKTKEIIKNIKDLVESKEDVTKKLTRHFETIDKMQKELVEKGIDQVDALFNILKGIANRTIRTDDIVNSNYIDRIVTTICRVPSSGLITGSIAMKASAQNAKIVSNLFNIGSKTGVTALKTFGKATAIFSVVFTLIDIGLLIRDWSSDHLTVNVIDDTINQLKNERKQLQDIMDYIKSLKLTVTVTYINEVPVIAMNDDMTNAVKALYTNQTEQFKQIFRENGIDFKQFDPKTRDDLVKYIIDNKDVKLSSEQILDKTLANLRGKSDQQSVTVLFENLLDTLKYDEPEKKSSRGEHVINNKVINVYKEIIDMFVKKEFNCSFDQLTKITVDSHVYQDYHKIIDEITKRNIQTVMVAEIPDDYIYIDINQCIYGVAILFLRYMAQVHMCHIYKVDKFQYSGSEYKRAISGCVDFMNNFDIIVDKVALEYWLRFNGGNIDTYLGSKHVVQMMLNGLLDRMATWVSEIRVHYPI